MIDASGTRSPWLQCVSSVANPEGRLICFAHAGGSAAFFEGWESRLPGIEVHAVQYPGRATRIDEPPSENLVAVACATAEALLTLPGDVPLALFGHSLGAAVALETARALHRHGGVRVSHLFASGSRNAPLPAPAEDVDPDLDQLFDELVTMGGTDAEMAADPVFREVTSPYLLADARMFRTYRMPATPILACPVTTIAGTEDSHADLRPWNELTTAGVQEIDVAGDHFYLTDDPPLRYIASALSQRAGDRLLRRHL
ncbi:alpha/beta fold hydrolase [Amycolatopsis sp. NPDC051102]|uniref:thioesterase II family protein n=1 Tax=Amycolatopsis sp. NPDC051102 TaxID=3155163 RepID=UPI0034156F7D